MSRLHVYAPSCKYVAQWRPYGGRRWRQVGEGRVIRWSQSWLALRQITGMMARDPTRGHERRWRVLAVPIDGYAEPYVVWSVHG